MDGSQIQGNLVTFELLQDDVSDLPGLTWRVFNKNEGSFEVHAQQEPANGAITGADIIAVISDPQTSSTDEETGNHYKILHLSPAAALSSNDTREKHDDSDEATENAHDSNGSHLIITRASHLPSEVLSAHYLSQLPSHLGNSIPDTSSPKIHVIVSTGSGTNQALIYFENFLEPALSALGLHLQPSQIHQTTSAQSVKEFTASHIKPQADRGIQQTILLLSGDGGVSDIVNELLSTHALSAGFVAPTIGLLALGTGNAIASSLFLTRNTHTLGLRDLLFGQPLSLPLFRATFHCASKSIAGVDEHQLPPETSFYGAAVFSYGLHASLVANSDTPEYRKYGPSRFQKAANDLLFPPDEDAPHSYRAHIHVSSPSDSPLDLRHHITLDPDVDANDDAAARLEHAYILLTPLSHLEPSFNISPLSDPSSPSLRLIHIPSGLSGKAIEDIMNQAYDGGKHIDNESVDYRAVELCTIQCLDEDEEWRKLCIDGQIFVPELGGEIEVELLGSDVGTVVSVVCGRD